MGYLRKRETGSSYFPRVSTHYPNNFVKYRKINPGIPLSTEKQIWDHYDHSNDKTRLWWDIFMPMHPATIRIYEFREDRITDEKIKPYEYSYVCTYDPTGKKLGHIHIHKESKPITAKRWVFQVLGPKNTYYSVHHYDSTKYKEEMKKYKEGKIKARPNGSKPCYLSRSMFAGKSKIEFLNPI